MEGMEQGRIWPGEHSGEGVSEGTVLVGFEKAAKKSGQDSDPTLPITLQGLYQQLDMTPKSVEKILEGLLENGGNDWTISGVMAGLMRLFVMGKAVQESPGYFSRKSP